MLVDERELSRTWGSSSRHGTCEIQIDCRSRLSIELNGVKESRRTMELMIFEGQLFSNRERQGNPNALRPCEADGSSTIASDSQGEDSAQESYLAGNQARRVGERMAPTLREKAAKVPAKRTVCNADDFLLLLDYLEDSNNFEKLFGAGRKAVVGGKYLKKEDAWDIATAELKAVGFKDTTGKNLNKKWQRYFGKYREAKKLERQSGGVLTGDELEKGLTIEKKLNGICDHFYKMDALLGTRVNITPRDQSGLMSFENFSGQSMPGKQQPEIVTVSTPSPTRDLSDEVHTPAWMKEQLDRNEEEQQIGGQEGELETRQPKTHPQSQQSQGAVRITQEKGPGSTQPPPVVGTDPASHTSPYVIMGTSAAAQNSQPPKTKRTPAGKIDHEKRKIGSTFAPVLANAFQESKAQEVEMKYKYIEKKDHWKMAELEDKREARFCDYKRRRLEMEFEAEQRNLDRLHRVETTKLKNKLELIIAGWTQGKSQEEITHMCNILDD